MRCMSTDMIWRTDSTSSADTERLGELLGKRLKGGEFIELRSDLGGGKTTFVRGLVKGIGSSDRVASPTFTLNRIYKSEELAIHHFDFYRLDEPGIMSEQLAEALSDKEAVIVVEWGDIAKNVLPDKSINIHFEPVASNPEERKITVQYPQSREKLIARLENDWKETRP